MREIRWVALPLVVSVISAVGSVAGPTHALMGSRSSTIHRSFRSLSTADALCADDSEVELDDLTVGEDVDWPDAVSVRNTSGGRTLELTVSLTGAPGLTAAITPQTLPPGATATIHIIGHLTDEGDLSATLAVLAFGGFLHLDIPVRGHVMPSPPPEHHDDDDPDQIPSREEVKP